MSRIRSVAVFCGSHPGRDPVYLEAAHALGCGLAEAGLRMVYGGGRIGLMGAAADAAVAAGGRVIGVIPEFLSRREVAHAEVSELIVTDSMHSRKRRMFDLADAFVTMPGGLGTFDETVEIITWRQLGLHDKPILICNVASSANALMAAFEDAIAKGFASAECRHLYEVVDGVPALLDRLQELRTPEGIASARL